MLKQQNTENIPITITPELRAITPELWALTPAGNMNNYFNKSASQNCRRGLKKRREASEGAFYILLPSKVSFFLKGKNKKAFGVSRYGHIVVEGYSIFIPTGDFMVPIPRSQPCDWEETRRRQAGLPGVRAPASEETATSGQKGCRQKGTHWRDTQIKASEIWWVSCCMTPAVLFADFPGWFGIERQLQKNHLVS